MFKGSCLMLEELPYTCGGADLVEGGSIVLQTLV